MRLGSTGILVADPGYHATHSRFATRPRRVLRGGEARAAGAQQGEHREAERKNITSPKRRKKRNRGECGAPGLSLFLF
eukprot:7522743-Heterocapsa_arctica.AAC.1